MFIQNSIFTIIIKMNFPRKYSYRSNSNMYAGTLHEIYVFISIACPCLKKPCLTIKLPLLNMFFSISNTYSYILIQLSGTVEDTTAYYGIF